jgi:hypothetical protein
MLSAWITALTPAGLSAAFKLSHLPTATSISIQNGASAADCGDCAIAFASQDVAVTEMECPVRGTTFTERGFDGGGTRCRFRKLSGIALRSSLRLSAWAFWILARALAVHSIG